MPSTAQASPLLLAAVLVAIAPSLDKLTVGTAFGIRGTKIATGPNLIIAGVTMAAMAGAMAFGRALTMLMPAETTLVLGSLILIVLGVWIVVARILALRDLCPTTTAPLRPRGHVVPSGAVIRPCVVVEAISFSGVRPGVARVPPVAPPCLPVVLPARRGRRVSRRIVAGSARRTAPGAADRRTCPARRRRHHAS